MSPEKLSISDHIWAWRFGRLAVLNVWDLDTTISSHYGNQLITTMPEGWRPKDTTFAAAVTNDTPINVFLHIEKNGKVYVNTTSGGDPITSKPVKGQLVYTTA